MKMQQIGTCVVFKKLGTYPAAACTECGWRHESIYEDELARAVAEHSALHRLSIKVTLTTTWNGQPLPPSMLPTAFTTGNSLTPVSVFS
jgi:hypothetical protein